jgi:hypothetical protein
MSRVYCTYGQASAGGNSLAWSMRVESACNRQYGGDVCGPWGNGGALQAGGVRGPGPPEEEKGRQLASDIGEG